MILRFQILKKFKILLICMLLINFFQFYLLLHIILKLLKH